MHGFYDGARETDHRKKLHRSNDPEGLGLRRTGMNARNVISLASKRPGNSRSLVSEVSGREAVSGSEEKGIEDAAPDEMTAHLVAVAERQDRVAFAALFQHFAPRLKSYFLRFGDASGRAEEVLQETFAAVWTKARLFDPDRASAATWIYTIARNQRIDAFRRERRPEFDPQDPAFVPEPVPDGEVSVTGRERARHVSAALADLSEDQREVVRLSFFEDESHDAIARRLGLPIGTVKSRIRLAYGHLRSRLGPHSGGLL